MKITAVYVRDYTRVKLIELDLTGRTWWLIGGKNAQGKSSLLNAIMVAIAGKKFQAADPVRHGAAAAVIRIEIDGGELLIERKIKPDGEQTLVVTAADGTVIRGPQEMLNGLFGRSRIFDPVAFLQLSAKDQRTELLAHIDTDGEIAKLERKRADAFAARTSVGQDQRKAEGEVARLPEVTPGEPVTVDQLTAELEAAITDAQAARPIETRLADARRGYTTAKADVDRLRADMERLRQELAAAEQRLAESTAAGSAAAAERAKLPKAEDVQQRITAARAAMAGAGVHNDKVAADRAAADRRARAVADAEQHRKAYDKLTAEIAEIDLDKDARLAASKLPVAGLGVTADYITLNGAPLAQASSAERLRLATALALSGKPILNTILVRDGALLDDDSLALVCQMAEAAGAQVLIERVGADDDGVIEIVDGGVR